MTSALYLEHYLDSLQHLPIELQRNFKLMRDLDHRAHGLMRTIDLAADNILADLQQMDDDVKNDKIEKIQGLFNKAKEYCDDKVQLAIQTYELVDKHIRRLDSDLAKFDSEIQDKAHNSRSKQHGSDADGNATGTKKGRKKIRGSDKTTAGAGKKKKSGASSEDDNNTSNGGRGGTSAKKKHHRKGIGTGVGGVKDTEEEDDESGSMAHPSDVLDMPVDPNEPTYCLCHQVSYGEMIGCDNPDCPIEWFHFACVGLTIKPKGKWYCPKCTQDRKRK